MEKGWASHPSSGNFQPKGVVVYFNSLVSGQQRGLLDLLVGHGVRDAWRWQDCCPLMLGHHQECGFGRHRESKPWRVFSNSTVPWPTSPFSQSCPFLQPEWWIWVHKETKSDKTVWKKTCIPRWVLMDILHRLKVSYLDSRTRLFLNLFSIGHLHVKSGCRHRGWLKNRHELPDFCCIL